MKIYKHRSYKCSRCGMWELGNMVGRLIVDGETQLLCENCTKEKITEPRERSQVAKFLGKLGGQASVKKRFAGKSKEEISVIMQNVRKSSKEWKEVRKAVKDEQA
jgi:hypothetical protein